MNPAMNIQLITHARAQTRCAWPYFQIASSLFLTHASSAPRTLAPPTHLSHPLPYNTADLGRSYAFRCSSLRAPTPPAVPATTSRALPLASRASVRPGRILISAARWTSQSIYSIHHTHFVAKRRLNSGPRPKQAQSYKLRIVRRVG